MITKITSINDLKQMFLEITLNKTNKVTDISKESVLNAISYGCAKLAQKILVNLAIIESHLFPDSAYGAYLDSAAQRRGVSARFSATTSSTFLRITADPGTFYQSSLLTFKSNLGVNFVLENDFTMPEDGFVYVKVKSLETGSNSNVDPISINKMVPNIIGHIACTNEFRASGGMDSETDEMFKIRIKESVNKLSRGTLSYIEQIFISINPEVLKIYKGGIDSNNKVNLYVVSTSGRDFTENEFNTILSKSAEFLSLNELMNESYDYNIKLNNIDWLYVDLDFRANLDSSFDVDEIRRNMQIQLAKLFDFRFWKYGDVVEFENLLFSVSNVDGVRYIPDAYFTPHYDININKYKLPRIRGFVLRDLDGNIIYDNNYVLNNFFYPNAPDNSFISSVLQSL